MTAIQIHESLFGDEWMVHLTERHGDEDVTVTVKVTALQVAANGMKASIDDGVEKAKKKLVQLVADRTESE